MPLGSITPNTAPMLWLEVEVTYATEKAMRQRMLATAVWGKKIALLFSNFLHLQRESCHFKWTSQPAYKMMFQFLHSLGVIL